MGQPQAILIVKLQEAILKGFIHDFLLNPQGDYYCHSQTIGNPEVTQIIPCEGCKATLYLLSFNGIKGTWVHHWES